MKDVRVSGTEESEDLLDDFIAKQQQQQHQFGEVERENPRGQEAERGGTPRNNVATVAIFWVRFGSSERAARVILSRS